jgi:hypothetical protein
MKKRGKCHDVAISRYLGVLFLCNTARIAKNCSQDTNYVIYSNNLVATVSAEDSYI